MKIPLPISEAELERRLASGQSMRAIARDIGMDRQTFRARAAPVVARLRAQPCACGRQRFHPGSCIETEVAHMPDGQERRARRARVISMIMKGMTYRQIADAIGAKDGKNLRATFIRHLTPEQRQRRRELQRTRTRRAGQDSPAHRDPLYHRLHNAVPRSIAPDLRDDIISEMYLAVLEGEATVEQAIEGAQRFINREIGKWSSKFGPASLNVSIFEDGGEARIESIADPRALAAFDRLETMTL